MAYLAFAESPRGAAAETAPRLAKPRHDAAGPVREPAFSAREWSVVAIARRDRLSSLRAPSRLTAAFATLFGGRVDPRLADQRLEALRRMAVLAWHHGYTLPAAEIRAFIAAGYTPDHYEALLRSVSAARSAPSPRSYR